MLTYFPSRPSTRPEVSFFLCLLFPARVCGLLSVWALGCEVWCLSILYVCVGGRGRENVCAASNRTWVCDGVRKSCECLSVKADIGAQCASVCM